MEQKKEKAIAALEQYADTVCSISFPLSLKGNQYFNKVDKWFEDNNCIGTNTPMDETTVKKNFINTVTENTAFAPLRENKRYKLLVKRLKEKLGEKK